MSKKSIHDESGMTLPKEIAEHGFDFPRDMDKLHALVLPTESIPIELLEWHLDVPFFWQKDAPFSLNPRTVVDNSDDYPYHMDKIISVDTSYPIDIMYWSGRWEILDGLHRYCKLYMLGDKIIQVRKVPVEWKEKIMPDYALES